MIERIPLKLVSDHMFFAIEGVDQHLDEEQYRTIAIQRFEQSGRCLKVINVVQVQRPAVLSTLALQYADAISGVAVSLSERCMDGYTFGFGDVAPGAPYLIIPHSQVGSAARLVAWLKKNIVGDAVTVEGSKQTRVSFSHPDDFTLARIKFS